VSNLKTRYRKLQAFADGGVVADDGYPSIVPERAAELTAEITDKDPAALRQKIDHLEADIQTGEDEFNRSQNERLLEAAIEPTSLKVEREAALQQLVGMGLNEQSATFFR
jgi:hypothetical protein